MRLTEAQERWLTALESGSYEKAHGTLRVDDRFCCLGVACDLYDSSRWKTHRKLLGYQGADVFRGETLPPDVSEYYGIIGEAGDIHQHALEPGDVSAIAGRTGMAGRDMTLAAMNDGGYTFREIAAIIRKTPDAFFETDVGHGG